MTVTANPRVPAAERIAVRCVDSDVHPTPRKGELGAYIPAEWRSKRLCAPRFAMRRFRRPASLTSKRMERVPRWEIQSKSKRLRPPSGSPSKGPDLAYWAL